MSGTGRQRRQLLVAGALTGASVTVLAAAAVLLGASGRSLRWATAAAAVLVLLALLAGAVVPARRAAVRVRTAAASVVAATGAVLFGLAVLVLVLGRLPDRREDALVWPVVLALVVAAVAYPGLRRGAVDAAGRGPRASRRSPLDVLDAFGERAARGTPAQELLLQLAESLRRDLRLQSAEVWVRSGDALQRLVAVPHRAVGTAVLEPGQVRQLRRAGVAGEAWLRTWLPELLPGRDGVQVRLAVARYGGDVLGLVVGERSRDGERFGPADERRLGDVVGRLGLALHNRELDSALQATLDDLRRTNEELRASRSRLVAAADAERRRIERDIHDGAQQHLVALAVTLGLARDLLADDAAAAGDLLTDMAADLKETIASLRDLAHGIYPPLLREAGLAEALRAAGGRSASPVSVVAGELARYGPEVESAVYFCCLEALQNSAKHAAGAAVRVDVGESGGLLSFAVADDGPGYDPAATSLGQGFQNMTDRLGAVGGTVTWTSAPGGGARVEGSVPVAVPAPPAPVPVG